MKKAKKFPVAFHLDRLISDRMNEVVELGIHYQFLRTLRLKSGLTMFETSQTKAKPRLNARNFVLSVIGKNMLIKYLQPKINN